MDGGGFVEFGFVSGFLGGLLVFFSFSLSGGWPDDDSLPASADELLTGGGVTAAPPCSGVRCDAGGGTIS